ncbi:hypothetical protein [uncultured Campylobacter sp.]|uniref:hypothetical protein n=1 Tax=uncultured Campylobacter sp. TaxID=218934 RepID=UPI002620D30F|nr:hypothetical protein [uncultured Campylobacter sp.]
MLCGANFKILLQCSAKPSPIGPCVAQNSIAARRTYRIELRADKILAAQSSHARTRRGYRKQVSRAEPNERCCDTL